MTEEQAEKMAFNRYFELMAFPMRLAFGTTKTLLSTDTEQFENYQKIKVTIFDVENKAKRRKEIFPKDCEKAFEMGRRFAIEEVKPQPIAMPQL